MLQRLSPSVLAFRWKCKDKEDTWLLPSSKSVSVFFFANPYQHFSQDFHKSTPPQKKLKKQPQGRGLFTRYRQLTTGCYQRSRMKRTRHTHSRAVVVYKVYIDPTPTHGKINKFSLKKKGGEIRLLSKQSGQPPAYDERTYLRLSLSHNILQARTEERGCFSFLFYFFLHSELLKVCPLKNWGKQLVGKTSWK